MFVLPFDIVLDDFSEFSNTQRYGEPTLPQLLNWIVADVSIKLYYGIFILF